MIPWLNGLSAAWFDWMSSIIWQSAVLIAIIWAADLLLRRFAWPKFRYMLWLLVLIKLLLPPSFTLPTSICSSSITTVQHFIHSNIPKLDHFSINGLTVQTQMETGRTDMSPAQSHHATVSLSLQTKLMLIWLGGVLLLAFWLYLRLRHLLMDHSQSGLPEWFPSVLQECAYKLSIKRVPSVVITPALKCPAVFGIFRPTILIPNESIGMLNKKQTSNILIHELMHIKRSDLLIHAVQITLQILYWPNVLLWLIRRPMHDLRELCCDASVAAVLHENTTSYRQTLIDMARRLIAEPANPGLGLLGLFERPYALVTRLKYLEKPYGKQTLCKYVSVFAALVMFVFVLPMSPMRAQTVDQEKPSLDVGKHDNPGVDQEKPSFEVVSIKRIPYDDHFCEVDFYPGGRFKAHAPLGNLIAKAYEIDLLQIDGISDLKEKPFWDIEAKPEEDKYPLKNGRLDPDLGRLMIQSMLEDRFKLKVHREARIQSGYELVVAKGGPRLKSVKKQTKLSIGRAPGILHTPSMSLGQLCRAIRISFLYGGEENPPPIVDKTGLEGTYEINLRWTPDGSMASIASQNQTADFSDISIDPEITIFDAIEEQLGLKLVPAKIPVTVVVVDSVQMPEPN